MRKFYLFFIFVFLLFNSAISDDRINFGNYRVGKYIGLLVLIDFPDANGIIPKEEIEKFCNMPGYNGYENTGSIRDYFLDVSGNNLDYSLIVTDYIRASKTRDYYNYLPEDRIPELVREIINKLAERNFDFSRLTIAPSTNEILSLSFYYAGGYMDGRLGAFASGIPLYNIPGTNFYVSRYMMTAIPSHGLDLGTFIHETCHMLMGWPDLYSYWHEGNGGIESYDIMCGGTQKKPIMPNPFFRHAAGWENVINITPDMYGQFSIVANSNTSYRYVNPKNPDEMFYIEARRQKGRSEVLPGEGILIWHVDVNKKDMAEKENQMTPEQHYFISVEQADGLFELERGICHIAPTGNCGGDPYDFFFAENNNNFNDYTIPSARWWDGSLSGLNITNISSISDIMTFEIIPPATGKFNLMVKFINQNPCNDSIFNISFKLVNYNRLDEKLKNFKIKMWFNTDDNIYTNGCWGGLIKDGNGNYIGNLNSLDYKIINNINGSYKEVTLSFNTEQILPKNGGTIEDINLQLYRGSWQYPFDDNCNDYSRPLNNSSIYSDNHTFALYINDKLIPEWISENIQDPRTGKDPYNNLTPVYTFTPTSTQTSIIILTPTYTFTKTLTATATKTQIQFTYTQTPTNTFTKTITLTPTFTGTLPQTQTPTLIIPTITPTPTFINNLNLVCEYFSSNTNSYSNTIYINLKITSNSSTNIDLSKMKIKYWYTCEPDNNNENCIIDYCGIMPYGININDKTKYNIERINMANQNRVLVLSFLDPGQLSTNNFIELKARIYKNDWSNYLQTNDYSFGNHNNYNIWRKITIYYEDKIIWGYEPSENIL